MPGGIATLFGTGIVSASGILQAAAVPLPSALGGTQVFQGTGLAESFFAGLAQGLDAVKGALDDVLEASFATLDECMEEGIVAGQGAEGILQAVDAFGGRQGGELEVSGFAREGPEAAETPGGGADFLERGLLGGVARGELQAVLPDGSRLP